MNVQNPPIARPQIQTILGGARVLGTVYQNIYQVPLYVAVSVNLTGVGLNIVNLQTDDNAAPVAVAAIGKYDATVAGGGAFLSAVVLPGNYYTLVNVAGTMAISKWMESY